MMPTTFTARAREAGLHIAWVGQGAVEVLVRMERGEEMLNRRVQYASHGKRTPSVTTPHAQMGVLVNAGLARYERDLGEAGGYVIEPKGREWLMKLRAARLVTKTGKVVGA